MLWFKWQLEARSGTESSLSSFCTFCCYCSVTQSCPTLCDLHGLQHARPPCPSPAPGACSDSCPLSQWCHPTICRPLLLLPSIFPSIRVCSNKLAPRLRWPKYWRFSFSISPSSEYSGLISFRIGWFDTGFLHAACLRHMCSFSFNFKNHKKKNPIDLEVVSHPRGLGCRIVSPT